MCLYFHAKWNPTCEDIADKYKEFCLKNGAWKHYSIDTDQHKRTKFFYDVHYEPSFYIFLNGSLVKRIVGYNFDLINQNLEYTIEAHHRLFDYYPETKDMWVDYHHQVDKNEEDVIIFSFIPFVSIISPLTPL